MIACGQCYKVDYDNCGELIGNLIMSYSASRAFLYFSSHKQAAEIFTRPDETTVRQNYEEIFNLRWPLEIISF